MNEKQRELMQASVKVAAARLGGVPAAAEAIGSSQVSVYRWINGESHIAAEFAIALADAADMKRADFRPDLWGEK